MAQNTTSNRGYDDTVYIPRQQRLRPMILTRKVQQFYLVYLCFPDGSENFESSLISVFLLFLLHTTTPQCTHFWK
jgi:hypothetical protein